MVTFIFHFNFISSAKSHLHPWHMYYDVGKKNNRRAGRHVLFHIYQIFYHFKSGIAIAMPCWVTLWPQIRDDNEVIINTQWNWESSKDEISGSRMKRPFSDRCQEELLGWRYQLIHNFAPGCSCITVVLFFHSDSRDFFSESQKCFSKDFCSAVSFELRVRRWRSGSSRRKGRGEAAGWFIIINDY